MRTAAKLQAQASEAYAVEEGLGEAGPEAGVVGEDVEGVLLSELLDKGEGALPPGLVARAAIDLADALGAAHGQSPPLLHLSLRPERILVTRGGELKILGFGWEPSLSRLGAERSEKAYEGCWYLSPEHVFGRPLGAPADLFSLGSCLYHALSGVLPFQGASGLATLINIKLGKLRPLAALAPDAPAPLLLTIEAMMAPQPAARPDPRAVQEALHKLALEPAEARERFARLVASLSPEAFHVTGAGLAGCEDDEEDEDEELARTRSWSPLRLLGEEEAARSEHAPLDLEARPPISSPSPEEEETALFCFSLPPEAASGAEEEPARPPPSRAKEQETPRAEVGARLPRIEHAALGVVATLVIVLAAIWTGIMLID